MSDRERAKADPAEGGPRGVDVGPLLRRATSRRIAWEWERSAKESDLDAAGPVVKQLCKNFFHLGVLAGSGIGGGLLAILGDQAEAELRIATDECNALERSIGPGRADDPPAPEQP